MGTLPRDGSGEGRIGTPPRRLRHGYRRCIVPRTFGPGHGTSGGIVGVILECLWRSRCEWRMGGERYRPTVLFMPLR